MLFGRRQDGIEEQVVECLESSDHVGEWGHWLIHRHDLHAQCLGWHQRSHRLDPLPVTRYETGVGIVQIDHPHGGAAISRRGAHLVIP